jgi:hypothetical protein
MDFKADAENIAEQRLQSEGRSARDNQLSSPGMPAGVRAPTSNFSRVGPFFCNGARSDGLIRASEGGPITVRSGATSPLLMTWGSFRPPGQLIRGLRYEIG